VQKFLRFYKDLENRKLCGYITDIVRLEERAFLFKFYPETWVDPLNYCPILGQHFFIKNFLEEGLIKKKSTKDFLQLRVYLGQKAFLKFQTSEVKTPIDIWNFYCNSLPLQNFNKRILKVFRKSEELQKYLLFLRYLRFFKKIVNYVDILQILCD